MIDFYASERHYFDHIVPVWNALDPENKGRFIVANQEVQSYAQDKGQRTLIGEPDRTLTLVASYIDYKKTLGPVVYMEHGIGHSYSNDHPSYAGGQGKDRVVLFLCQHDLTAEKNKKTYPQVLVKVIGTPKLDKIEQRGIRGRTVAISWHWDCQVAPETRSSLPHFRRLIELLKEAEDVDLIGHAHPRPSFRKVMKDYYAKTDVEFIEDFDEVLDRADLYIIDNSSSAYEFAAAGRPVIHLNAPWYRKDVNHGIRFWDYLPGPTADTVEEALKLVKAVLDNPEIYDQQRKKVVAQLYPFLGQSSKKAAEEIKKFLTKG